MTIIGSEIIEKYPSSGNGQLAGIISRGIGSMIEGGLELFKYRYFSIKLMLNFHC